MGEHYEEYCSETVARQMANVLWQGSDLAKVCGIPWIKPPQIIKNKSLAELRKSEWDSEFERLMRNRLLMGYYRYGPFETQNRTTEQMFDSIIHRANEYIKTGNDELLVDIANLCMKEFAVGNHKNKHFEAVDDGKHVGE